MSLSLEPSSPLKGKLSHVRYILDDANKRLQEEASKYEIFTTKTSKVGSSGISQNGDCNLPPDLMKTMSDISTLKSVLACPIFNRIVNVTDSLDKLSHQLNLHPSIGPSDINIDANGELILAPPMESTALNNLINSQLDEYSDNSSRSNQMINSNTSQNNIKDQHNNDILQSHLITPQEVSCSDEYVPMQQEQKKNLHSKHNIQQNFIISAQSFTPSPTTTSPLNSYDTEKLVSNGYSKHYDKCDGKRQYGTKTSLDGTEDDRHRLYKSNGHFTLEQMTHNGGGMRNDFHSTQSMNQMSDQFIKETKNGYSNEMYKTTDELNQYEPMAISEQDARSNRQTCEANLKNVQYHNIASNGRTQSITGLGLQCNRGSCSPSTSVGSTVRLADDCDSGASSYQSQNAKNVSYSPYSYKTSEHTTDSPNPTSQHIEERSDSHDNHLIDNLSPEMERIKVTLEKDSNGLGITIAGYTCEKEEISGIFVKSITPDSPADRSGKIRTLDQIYAVNGRELLGYTNPEAVNVLRQTGRVVTLELMRYLAESKYKKLQTALTNAVPNLSSKPQNQDIISAPTTVCQSSGKTSSPIKSSIPVSKLRDTNNSPTKSNYVVAKPTYVQVSGNQLQHTQNESHNVDTASKNADGHKKDVPITASIKTQLPVAAQRGCSNKVIETKQGARNTIEIRSPTTQTTPATYVNDVTDSYIHDSNKKNVSVSRFNGQSSDDFGQLMKSEEPEWEKEAQIIELCKASDGLGFTVKEYANPKDQKQSIIMITSITPGGVAEGDGRLAFGDLLIFVDDTNLKGAGLAETVKTLKRTNGQVRLGVLKLKRD